MQIAKQINIKNMTLHSYENPQICTVVKTVPLLMSLIFLNKAGGLLLHAVMHYNDVLHVNIQQNEKNAQLPALQKCAMSNCYQ